MNGVILFRSMPQWKSRRTKVVYTFPSTSSPTSKLHRFIRSVSSLLTDNALSRIQFAAAVRKTKRHCFVERPRTEDAVMSLLQYVYARLNYALSARPRFKWVTTSMQMTPLPRGLYERTLIPNSPQTFWVSVVTEYRSATGASHFWTASRARRDAPGVGL